MAPRAIPPVVRDRQAKASRPDAHAWVSANAGSGKTHVLTQRVIRLLLAGTPPSKILCLTFTKAAAATMAMRVFDRLARWVSLDDAALSEAIAATGSSVEPGMLREARRLFSRAIESPGGLKIQTIHAFCESILHSFPFESNTPSGFRVLEEGETQDLLQRARSEAFMQSAPDPAFKQAVETLANGLSLDGFDTLIADAIARRDVVATLARSCANWPADHRAMLAVRLGVEPHDTLPRVEAEIQKAAFSNPRLCEIADALLRGGGKNDAKFAAKLRDVAACADDRRCDAYLALFFFEDGRPRAKLVAAAGQKADPGLLKSIEDEIERLSPLVARRRALAALDRSDALIVVLDDILRRYAALKNAEGALDFEDLIERASSLLGRLDKQWVLYKLDAGIDHILVDEAQDTSARQWGILKELAAEYMSGEGRSPGRRTFFAVGDHKQSIYSFQGAEPALFRQAKDHFATRVRDSKGLFHDVRLDVSFRSAPGILKAVDTIFSHGENRAGVSDEDIAFVHAAWKNELQSLVELWPPVGPDPQDETPDWRLPVDATDARDPAVVLARRIADLIDRLLRPDAGESVWDETLRRRRPVAAGDVMILLRRRGALYEALIRALKQKGLPVAGADRMVLRDHIAVMDLIAAGKVCLLPDDDLSLACVLKSPLVGLDDDDLIALAPLRPASLWVALSRSQAPAHREAFARLTLWRDEARRLTPFFFYASLLEAQGGRRDLLARLGAEAGDAIDEFLRLALDMEGAETPALERFLHHIETGDVEIKRDMEAASESIRVMTAHGAKGLESKIVLLPDTCQEPAARESPLFTLKAGGVPMLAWSSKKADDCAVIAAARDARRREAMNEYRRLLYVAATRAEERLYIMGCHGARKPTSESWYCMVTRSLEPMLTSAPAFWNDAESVQRWLDGDWPLCASDVSRVEAHDAPPLPAWLTAPVAARRPTPPLRPSAAHAAPAWPPAARAPRSSPLAPRQFGRVTHQLLQALPAVAPDARAGAAERLLRGRGDIDAATRAAMIDQALAVIDCPQLAPLFTPGAIAEAPIAGTIALPSGRALEISGRIDRFAVHDDAIWLADFKTGASDASDQADRLQLALYTAALRAAMPGKRTRTWLVRTRELLAIELMDGEIAALLGSA